MRPAPLRPTRLLWLDLEMTGLDPAVDLIVEVAAVVTDFEFKSLGSFDSAVRQPLAAVEARLAANPWFESQPDGYLQEIISQTQAGQPLAEVEARILALVDRHFPASEAVILAGNSIRVDRAFVDHYWPRLAARCHYRMLDVSAWKVYFQGRWGLEYQKQGRHRATADIAESIAELQYYLDQLGRPGDPGGKE